VVKPSKSKYINYVAYAKKLQELDHDQLYTELNYHKCLTLMCEQELRSRKQNQKILNLAKEWKKEETKNGTKSGTK
jgi:hypothetical protein